MEFRLDTAGLLQLPEEPRFVVRDGSEGGFEKIQNIILG